jgi:hypothetical protein
MAAGTIASRLASTFAALGPGSFVFTFGRESLSDISLHLLHNILRIKKRLLISRA